MNKPGVFLTTIREDSVEARVATAQTMGFAKVQVGKLPATYYTDQGARSFAALLAAHGLQAPAVTIVYDGEIYRSWASVQETCGLLPPDLLPERMIYSRACIDLAAVIGAHLVTFHMGVLPEDASDAGHLRLFKAVGELAEYARSRSITIGLETGQESPEAMVEFLRRLGAPNVGINLDNANMVLYGTGDPVEAIDTLAPYLVGVHLKDGLPPVEVRGNLGRSVQVGDGAARVRDCLLRLKEVGYKGDLIIEEYAGDFREAIPQAKQRIESWLSEL